MLAAVMTVIFENINRGTDLTIRDRRKVDQGPLHTNQVKQYQSAFETKEVLNPTSTAEAE